MLTVNLAPTDEAPPAYWWIPDLMIFAVGLVGVYFGVNYYFDAVRQEVAQAEVEISSLQSATTQLDPDLKVFAELESRIKDFRVKVESIRRIAMSKVTRYRNVILLEHLQTLKPDGVWFHTLTIPANEPIKITGGAFDNLLLAEFIAALLVTRNQEIVTGDLRSQVYFDNARLEATRLQPKGRSKFPDVHVFAEFSLQIDAKEREVESTGEPVAYRSEAGEQYAVR